MGGSKQPFMYEPVMKDDERFPAKPFDPKAVTRASYEAKKPKPKPKGPLVSFNRHPDAHAVPTGRSRYRPLGRRTKGWIKGMRTVQLLLRIPEVVGAVGLVVVMSMSGLIGWVMGATLGVVILHCLYSIFHHARPAGARTPGSSAAYQLFSAVSDLCVLPLYAYGALTTRDRMAGWTAQPPENPNIVKYMAPAVYYGLIGAGGLHVLSLAISLWLGFMFRRISRMPPDMNPLEANLTSRVHKRNKSSVVTTSTYSDNEKRPDSQSYDDLSRPPSIPFMHTRQGSQTSIGTRDSRVDLPSRQYQITPSNRSSAASASDLNLKRMSAPPASSQRGSYIGVPPGETDISSRPSSVYSSRPSTGTVPSYRAEPTAPASPTAQPRSAKFTETWYASESLINRTQQRKRAMNNQNRATNRHSAYESFRRQDLDLSGSDSEGEGRGNHYTASSSQEQEEDHHHHPNPLRSNPTLSPPTSPPSSTSSTQPATAPSPTKRPRTPFSRLRDSVLRRSLHPDDDHATATGDITDEKKTTAYRNRDSSIQPDADFSFYAKPYGELKPGTPPIMVGSENANGNGNGRQVSSGNDLGGGMYGNGGRYRGVSGKLAEEGRVGVGGYTFQ